MARVVKHTLFSLTCSQDFLEIMEQKKTLAVNYYQVYAWNDCCDLT